MSENVVYVSISGLTASGKSAVAGEIEWALKAIGLDVTWQDSIQEKNATHANWAEALEMYKPRVVISEANCSRVAEPVTLQKPDPRDPDPSREGIFRYHNCSKCNDGKKACVNGSPSRCDYPHARND